MGGSKGARTWQKMSNVSKNKWGKSKTPKSRSAKTSDQTLSASDLEQNSSVHHDSKICSPIQNLAKRVADEIQNERINTEESTSDKDRSCLSEKDSQKDSSTGKDGKLTRTRDIPTRSRVRKGGIPLVALQSEVELGNNKRKISKLNKKKEVVLTKPKKSESRSSFLPPDLSKLKTVIFPDQEDINFDQTNLTIADYEGVLEVEVEDGDRSVRKASKKKRTRSSSSSSSSESSSTDSESDSERDWYHKKYRGHGGKHKHRYKKKPRKTRSRSVSRSRSTRKRGRRKRKAEDSDSDL